MWNAVIWRRHQTDYDLSEEGKEIECVLCGFSFLIASQFIYCKHNCTVAELMYWDMMPERRKNGARSNGRS
jgi:hypothetical protein